MRGKRPDWSRPLPEPLTIPTVMTLRRLSDVRELVERHLPAEHRQRDTWQHVAAQLQAAARGGDPLDVSIALRMVLAMEGVECRLQKFQIETEPQRCHA